MLILALQGDRVLTFRIMSKDETVDGNIFLEFLRDQLKPAVQRQRIRHPIILMDNATPHIYGLVRDFIASKGWDILTHPAYSPDLNPCDYEAIARIKYPLKGARYSTEAGLMDSVSGIINGLSEAHAFTGIYNLPSVWRDTINSGGDYPS